MNSSNNDKTQPTLEVFGESEDWIGKYGHNYAMTSATHMNQASKKEQSSSVVVSSTASLCWGNSIPPWRVYVRVKT